MREFEYDPFQLEAIGHIKAGHSVIVSAPTGAGKTAIAEYVLNECIAKDENAIYTAPIKALSNQKYRDFRQKFGERIGILTGDVSINTGAPVLIMTTEIFRNKVLEKRGGLDSYSWIIFDEVHYLDDHERGTVWEESLIFLPRHMKLLALSATIPNIEEFAGWIAVLHNKPVHVVKEDKRPVPLHFFYQIQGEIVDNMRKAHELMHKGGWPLHPYDHGGRRSGHRPQFKPNRPAALIKHLAAKDMLPCIYFSFGRRRCEYLAEEISGFDLLGHEEKREIRDMYAGLCARHGLAGEKSAACIAPFIERGIAYHHAGMLPTLKETVERLFTSGLIKVIFTTETFALGINMPARAVVFDELRKFYGTGFAVMKTRDFYQMAGRAGRRGIDTEGSVYTRVNPNDIKAGELERIVYGEPEAVRSRFNVSYATILNLYNMHGERLYDIYPLSFHYFQERRHNREQAVRLMRAKVSMLKELGYIRDGAVSEKGTFASKIYGYELSLTEFYNEGLLDVLSETELAMTCLALVFEPRKGAHSPHPGKTARRLKNMTDAVLKKVHRAERRYGITPLSKDYHYHLSPSMEAWLRNEPFDDILKYTGTDEGELIRFFRMCVQILREILDTPVSPGIKGKIHALVTHISRGVVDAEKQLRA